MEFSEFEASLTHSSPPAGLSPLAKALWLDRKGEFDAAHSIAQEISSEDGARIHAYLHRKEGDLGNAGYWYRRARDTMPSESLEHEWEALVRRLL